MVRAFCLTCVAAGLALLPALAQAQQAEQQPPRERQADRPAQRGQQRGQQAERVTEQLAAWLAMIDYAEIELGQLAQKQADDPAVKEFAERMVKDHTQHLQKLQQFMPTLSRPGQPGARERTTARVTPEGRIPREPQEADDRPEGRDRAGRAGQARRGHPPMLQVGTEASKRALQMTKEMLSEQEGMDFDWGYMSQQVIAHTHAVATLEAMQGKGSPEFQQVVDAGLKATRQHLEEARQITKKLDRKEEDRQQR